MLFKQLDKSKFERKIGIYRGVKVFICAPRKILRSLCSLEDDAPVCVAWGKVSANLKEPALVILERTGVPRNEQREFWGFAEAKDLARKSNEIIQSKPVGARIARPF